MPPRLSLGVVHKTALAVALAFGCLAVLLAGAGAWMRPVSDDYLFERYLDNLGFLDSLLWWYQEWQGRWVSQFVINLLYGTGYWFIPVLPVALTVIWATGGIWFLRRLGADWLLAIGIVSCTLGLAFSLTPNLFDSFYWAAASLFHSLPLALAPFLGVLLVPKSESPLRLPLIVLLSLAITGMSELFDVWLIPVLLFVALVRRERYTWGAFIAAAIGSAIVVAAPGNFRRTSVYPGHISIGQNLVQTLHWSGFLWNHLLRWELLLGLAAAFLLAYSSNWTGALWRPRLRWAAATALTGGVATYLCLLLVLIGTHGTAPQLRVYTVPAFLAIAGLMGSAMQLGWWCRIRFDMAAQQPSPDHTIAILALIFGTLLTLPSQFIRSFAQMSRMQRFAADWTARDTRLRQQAASGHLKLYCRRLPGAHYDIWLDSTYYVNQYMAYHYTHNPNARVILLPESAKTPNSTP